jgi:hypothetical protein
MKKCSCATLIFLLVAGGACVAQSDQPSLGSLAKTPRQQKKTVKVFTNDDVATVRPDTPGEPAKSDSAPAGAPAASAAAINSSDKAKDAAKTVSASKDSPQVAELKQKLSSYKAEQEGWKSAAKRYEGLLASETSDFRRQMYEDALRGDKRNVEIFQEKIDQTQAELAKAEKSSSQDH